MQKAAFRLDVGDERLWKGTEPIQISNKAFRLLRLFVRNPNRLLTKDHILEDVWQDLYVSEGLVKEYVHDLRTALGDDPKQPQFIETVHGRGYRFLGGVEEEQKPNAEAHRPVPTSRRPALTILPFSNLTDGDRWERFCRGLVDDLITDLARYPDLTVIAGVESLDATGQPNDAAPCGYVLRGSVQTSDITIRVNVRLVDASNDAHIWAEQYDREIGEVFAIQSDVVGHVASAIGGFSGQIPNAERARLGRTPPGDLKAYELYLLSHELEVQFDRGCTFRAFDLARRAVDLDPELSRAWLVVGWTCWQILVSGWAQEPNQYLELRRIAFSRAATLDPMDPFALIELASVRAADGDLTGAKDAIERALDLGRRQADVLIVGAVSLAMVLDETQRAHHVLRQGLGLLPMVTRWQQICTARVAFFAQDFEAAEAEAKRGPDNLLTQLVRILAMAQLGRKEETSLLVETFKTKHPGFSADRFVQTYPIAAPGAARLFLDGVDKAGLGP